MKIKMTELLNEAVVINKSALEKHLPDIKISDLMDSYIGNDGNVTDAKIKSAAKKYWREEGYDEFESGVLADKSLSDAQKEQVLELGSKYASLMEKKFIEKILRSN